MKESGHILLDGDVIRYRSAASGDWDLPVSDVRIIGEATNQNGPFADDYFFCFASGPGMWHEASFYAEGRDEFLRLLGAKLGSPLQAGLYGSADFASRVLWPPQLAGEPMFDSTTFRRRAFLVESLGHGKFIRRTANESRRCWPVMASQILHWTGAPTVLVIQALISAPASECWSVSRTSP
jgi:hypothetical protein